MKKYETLVYPRCKTSSLNMLCSFKTFSCSVDTEIKGNTQTNCTSMKIKNMTQGKAKSKLYIPKTKQKHPLYV